MFQYILKRLLIMVPTLIAISFISYVIIELPPGDYLTSYINRLQETGNVDPATIEAIKVQWGLDKPWYLRYVRWITRFVQGDFGWSLAYNAPVKDMILARLGMSVAVSLSALLFSWLIALPIGIYSAVRQYSAGDYLLTFVGFLGLSIPEFLLALVLMFVSYEYLGISVGGLFSPEYQSAPWSLARVWDLAKHLAFPTLVVGLFSTAGIIRIMRANLLDELKKPYVMAARAKGLKKWKLILKYPVRVALNPFISTVGWILPGLISGEAIVSTVLAIPTAGPLFIQALLEEDMALAGSFVLLTATLTVIGTLLSDILLALVDPRIRLEASNR